MEHDRQSLTTRFEEGCSSSFALENFWNTMRASSQNSKVEISPRIN